MSQFIRPRLKVQWARNHIGAIRDVLQAFLQTEPFRLSMLPDGIQLEIAQELPADVPLHIGDAIHNMRTALDLLACDLARLNGESAHNVYFPFAQNANDLDEQIRKKKFRRAGSDAVALLKTMEPYTGGNALLRGIHDLDILDKHQLIVPVFSTAMVRELRIATPQGRTSTFRNCQFIGRRFRIGVPPGCRIEPGYTIEARPAFAAGTPQPFTEADVIKSLEEGAELVLCIVEAFEALRFGKGPRGNATAGEVGKS